MSQETDPALALAVDISSATNVSFSYSVFFPNDFDFVKGGKLPGLYGGDQHGCSGGSSAETCFSARLMFRTGGMGELYLYAPREKQVDALCTLGPLSYCNSVYGMSIGRGSWTFERGAWSNIRQDIWLNTPGKPDGGFNIWCARTTLVKVSTCKVLTSISLSQGQRQTRPPLGLCLLPELRRWAHLERNRYWTEQPSAHRL